MPCPIENMLFLFNKNMSHKITIIFWWCQECWERSNKTIRTKIFEIIETKLKLDLNYSVEYETIFQKRLKLDLIAFLDPYACNFEILIWRVFGLNRHVLSAKRLYRRREFGKRKLWKVLICQMECARSGWIWLRIARNMQKKMVAFWFSKCQV